MLNQLFFLSLLLLLLLFCFSVIRRRISDDGTLAVAISFQSPNNNSFSRLDDVVDDATASRSAIAVWNFFVEDGRVMNLPVGELDVNALDRAMRRLRA